MYFGTICSFLVKIKNKTRFANVFMCLQRYNVAYNRINGKMGKNRFL